MSKDSLDAPVNYEAEDSAVIMVPEKKIVLYGKTHTTYKNVTLDAPRVELDQKSNVLVATGEKDSLGETLTRARMQEGDNKFQSDTIRYNFKSQKGLLANTITQQSEMFIHAEVSKKVDSNTVYIRGGRFTTCDLDEPHFAFRANKLKIINNKVAVSGPMHPEFEGVPIPIYLPFGYYPLSKGRHSGLIAPQFVATETQGIGLEGLGYYQVLNDYWDVLARGSIYSYGGWNASSVVNYRKRYRFEGGFNLSFLTYKQNFRGDPDYSSSKTFNIQWRHATNAKARPGVTFSANVNAGSTQYNKLQQGNLRNNLNNQLNSSITYSKNWQDKPYQLTLSANHNQNAETRRIDLSLPDANFNVNTIYPLQRREVVGAARWYEKLGVSYNGSFRNRLSFLDTNFNIPRILDSASWGASHSVPLSVSLPALGPVMVTPGINFSQQWMRARTFYNWNPGKNKVDTVTEKGLYTASFASFGLGVNTSIFGTFQFRHSRLMAIRHTIRPTFAINYTPNLARSYYRNFQSDSLGTITNYNIFQAASFYNNGVQYYQNGEFGGMSFGVENVLEGKWRSKKDTGDNAIKKIHLIDGFGFSLSYNFLADIKKLGNIEVHLRSTLFDKVNLNVQGNLSPYGVDENGRETETYAWKSGFGIGRLENLSVSLSTQFRSEPRDPSKTNTVTSANNNNRISDPTLLADQARLADYMRRNPSEFVDFNIPYDLGLDFALGISRRFEKDFKVRSELNSGLNFHSSFSLTEKWNFSTYGYYDLNTMKLQALNLSINRDLHCWQMSIGLSPLGQQRYFSISISPKSGILQNLKVNRTRYFTDF
ncbi:putative LPS assembly protein LptD [Flaviaesturariibacter aridisoli]|uniref:LPS-assembly protein LptD n=1 Tax=Flaviaesturariibacter aridisoli TaxID=2545761 RepID=A0A4R4DY82_9BACT|nr:putative LPS assembly protein LptD [Flaviaesturariibacter aridisoli]TCZ68084.1 LPS-assembly protein LptD [Flaviaesturariibacter aridisoli]